MACISNFVISHQKLEILISKLKQREGNPHSYINLENKSLGEQQCHIHFRSTQTLVMLSAFVKHNVIAKIQIKQRCFNIIYEEYQFISNYKPSSGLNLVRPYWGTASGYIFNHYLQCTPNSLYLLFFIWKKVCVFHRKFNYISPISQIRFLNSAWN